MIWDKIETQPFVTGILKTHVETGRLAATYILSGDVQSGKEEMAQALACALNCEEKKSFESCACASCMKILNGNHPDVRWLGKAEERARSIKIEEVRDMLNWVYLKPYEGEWKVFIVTEADRLTLEAANALLKTLEEPPARTIFCLLVENRSNLLETIQSRSFKLKLRANSNIIEPDL
ncbi:MAG: DNA polymerase III subunit delta, partial [Candidatus Omnitrophica bacterium]|nr:DNA polymerase III subunit delta [Candidatus Omnitrophota bacterium]